MGKKPTPEQIVQRSNSEENKYKEFWLWLWTYLDLTHKSICLFLLNCEIQGQQRIELRVIIIDISHHYIHRSSRGLKTRNLQVTSTCSTLSISNLTMSTNLKCEPKGLCVILFLSGKRQCWLSRTIIHSPWLICTELAKLLTYLHSSSSYEWGLMKNIHSCWAD